MRRCVFLDRDGVINFNPNLGEYILRWEDFRLIPSVVDWIRLFNALDLLVIVVTNQRCVALGLITSEQLTRIHENMQRELRKLGAHVDDVFCCPHDKDVCNCRKPQPGMVLEAARKWDVCLAESVMIGDSVADRELTQRCGMRFVAVAEGHVVDSVKEDE